jgi:ketosteroid isomerase-like protein
MPARTPEETHALLEAAFNAGDLDALAEVYEEDAALIVPPEAWSQAAGTRYGARSRRPSPSRRRRRSSSIA